MYEVGLYSTLYHYVGPARGALRQVHGDRWPHRSYQPRRDRPWPLEPQVTGCLLALTPRPGPNPGPVQTLASIGNTPIMLPQEYPDPIPDPDPNP